MEKLNRNKVILGVITGVVLTTAIYFIWKKRRISGFRRRVIDNANREWELWGKPLIEYGEMVRRGASETDAIYDERVGHYWKNLGRDNIDGDDDDYYWSSAFISFIMKKSGAGDDFPYTSRHSRYIVPFIQNRKQNNRSPFKAYKLSEKKVEIGDLVCYSRQSGVTYDTTDKYDGHCDIVVDVNRRKGYIEVIGGNVSDGVTKRVLKIDKKGYLDDNTADWLVIIKNKK